MNAQPAGEIVLYQRGDTPAIDVRLDGDTVWLSQQQLADLFQTSRTNVLEHIANIYAEGELNQVATCREFRQFRIWATERLREYLVKGFTMDDERHENRTNSFKTEESYA